MVYLCNGQGSNTCKVSVVIDEVSGSRSTTEKIDKNATTKIVILNHKSNLITFSH